MISPAAPIRIKPEWNVNRLIVDINGLAEAIRIKPEWNVNDGKEGNDGELLSIRIKPEWNVKSLGMLTVNALAALE